ncbi:MAG: Fic family protein [Bacteroidales bacterium]|nr:Fic family protein [Bacteroidales bacterium]MDD3201286.1 Fic family protein [Bacteroidales bacterium]
MSKLTEAYDRWISLQPFSHEDSARLDRKFMLAFNYNSNHIEGNTLTYGQTEVLLLMGEVIGSAKMKDLEDMKAHNLCLNLMIEEAKTSDHLSESFIKRLHQVMLREDYTVYRELPSGLKTSYVVHAGTYKTRPNSVITPTGERFEYASVEETPSLMCDLIQWYNDEEKAGNLNPVELAALFHYRYIRIHPFEDGNGRIARLIVNYILLRHNYPMIVVLSRKKRAYLNALTLADVNVGIVPSDGSCASLDQIKPFVKYMTDLMISEINQIISFLNADAKTTWWYDGETVKFRSPKTVLLLQHLQKNPKTTIAELSSVLDINTSAVQKQLSNLLSKGYITKDPATNRYRVIAVSTTK